MKQKVMMCVNFWNSLLRKTGRKAVYGFRQLYYKAEKYWSRVVADLGRHTTMKLSLKLQIWSSHLLT